MKEILTIKNLKKHFPVKNAWGTDVALVKALDGVDLKIESGKPPINPFSKLHSQIGRASCRERV